MARSLLSHLPTTTFSSPLRPFPRRHLLAAAALVPSKTLVPGLHSRRFSTVVRAMPPSGADAGKPAEGGVAAEANPIVPSRPAGAPGFALPNIPIWARWVLGSIFCLAIPLYKRFSKIEEEVETTVETVAEVAEEVAKVAKKMAEDVASGLPEDSSLRKVAVEVEEIASEVIDDAEKAKSFIHQVDEMKEEVEEFAKPIIKGVEILDKDGK